MRSKKPIRGAVDELRELHRERLLEHPSYLIRRAFQISSALFERHFEDVQLTSAQWSVMVSISTFPGIDQTEAARAAALDKTSVARAVRDLIRRKLISVDVPGDDSRRRLLTLTRSGIELREAAMVVSNQLGDTFLSLLPSADRPHFLRLLRAFVVAGEHHSRAPFRMPRRDD